MSGDFDPYGAAAEDARKLVTRWRDRLIDFGKKYATAALVKTVVPSVGAVALAFMSLPLAAAAVCGAVIVALCIYATYTTRQLKRRDAELQQAWIANYRIRQRHLDHQIATDNVTLELMGERPQQHKPFRSVPQELRSALHYVHHRQREAEARADAAEAEKNGTATNAQRRALVAQRRDRPRPAPKGPAIEPIKRRRDARVAEAEAMEAEIQTLALPGDRDWALKLENAKRTQRERQDAAMEAAQAARDRARAGLRPTTEEPESVITLGMKASGDHDVKQGRRPSTPEQIFRGEGAARDNGA